MSHASSSAKVSIIPDKPISWRQQQSEYAVVGVTVLQDANKSDILIETYTIDSFVTYQLMTNKRIPLVALS
jgi:hypothetical protein